MFLSSLKRKDAKLSMNVSLELYRKLYTIRACEQYIIDHYHEDEMKTPMHMSMGQEAISVGVLHALGDRAQVFCSYRSHAAYLARTDDIEGFFAELYGKVTGPNRGRAGSMHIANPEKGHMLSSGIVASQIPPAVGMAYANKRLENGKIVVVFFGDGATNEGAFWESLNVACLMKLPILFVCEDNGFAVHTPKKQRNGYRSLRRLNASFCIPIWEYEGMWAEDICIETHDYVTDNCFPTLFHFTCWRYLGHVGVDEDYDVGYRSRKELEQYKKYDPVDEQKAFALETNSVEGIRQVESLVRLRIQDAVAAAKSAPFPDNDELLIGVYSEANHLL